MGACDKLTGTHFLPHRLTTALTGTFLMGSPKNVLGSDLEPCSVDPMTGFYRDGCCRTGVDDIGLHLVCIEATDEFLRFSKSRGNDLSTPNEMYQFPGLVAGDRWCLCVERWKEALEAGM